jgi:hypothetical protein
VEVAGITYLLTMGSDVDRDGMYLEATISTSSPQVVAEVFYSDTSGRFTVSCFKESIPIEVLEYLLAEARRRLPPREGAA